MRLLFRSLLIVGLLFLMTSQSQAQSLSDLTFKERLWYGGGFNLGFSGGTGISVLQVGISPMVGYKLTPRFSIGPRVSTLVSFYWVQSFNGERQNTQPVNWGAGLFSRYKITSEIFAHVEYEYANQALVEQTFDGLSTRRITNDNIYIGAGYSSGMGPGKFEILGLYNINQNFESFDSPFSIRFGFTQNF